MTEEKKQESGIQEQKIQLELNTAAMPLQDDHDQRQLFEAASSDGASVSKKRVITRRKKQPVAEQKTDVAESILAGEAAEPVVTEEAAAESKQVSVVKRTRRTAAPKSQSERDVSSEDTISLQEPMSEALQVSAEGGSEGGARVLQAHGADLGDAPKPTRRRVTRKRAGAQESDEEGQPKSVESDSSAVKDKHEKKRSRSKPGSSERAASQSANKVDALSFLESKVRFVQHYHQVVTYLDDLSFRDALAKLHGQQNHWKPQLEEAISVFLDEALYVEESMSLLKLRRAVATASGLWGAAYAAVVYTQGQFMRAAKVVARLMQSLGEIMQLDFVVPVTLAEAFKPVQPQQVDQIDTQARVDEDATSSDQKKVVDNTPSSRNQQAEGGPNTLLGVLQPFSASASSTLLEEAQKRFTGVALRVRQYTQSGVAQSSSYGYLVGVFYAELTVTQLALLDCVEREQQQDKEGHHGYAFHEAWALLGQFKSELLPLIRATGVFSVEGDRRRGRGHTGMTASESLTPLLAVMSQSVSTAPSVEPNHNSQQHVGQGYFQPPDLD